jgi:hypothetical protein
MITMPTHERVATTASQGTMDALALRRQDSALARQLSRLEQLPEAQRFDALCELLAAHVDLHASTSDERAALPFASGFRTLCDTLRQQRDLSPQTMETLRRFLAAWLQALMEQDAVVNVPSISHHPAPDGTEINLTWRRGERSLEVTCNGASATYGATAFAADRHLDVQEGDLDLSVPALGRTIAWLVGKPVD